MSDRKWRTWEVLGLIFVLAAGNLLHFVYDWSGQSPVVGALAAVNESTWEHMKLLTTPWVLWSIVELIALRGWRLSPCCFTGIRGFWAGTSCGWTWPFSR